MQRFLTCALAAVIALWPEHALAHGRYESGADRDGTAPKKNKQKKRAPPHVAAPQREVEPVTPPAEEEAPAKAEPEEAPAVSEPAVAPRPAPTEDDSTDLEDNPSQWAEALGRRLPPRRYPYVLGGVLAATGFVFAYQAQGEAKRAETITSSLEAQRAVQNARASAALADVLWVIAGAAVLLALVLELLPEPIAEKASPTFHF